MSPAADDAGTGLRAITWAERRMPVLRAVASHLEQGPRLAGVRIGLCLPGTAETAALARALAAGGAQVDVVPSNPLGARADVLTALASGGVAVHHAGGDPARHEAALAAVAEARPAIVLDDGADLGRVLHERGVASEVLGATEGTTTGVLRLRGLAERGRLDYPVLALPDTPVRHLFDNRLGTGQSVIDALLRTTNILLAGRCVVVIGYGSCGRGIATRAAGLGAETVVCEVDPVRALEARMDGHQVMPAVDAAAQADVLITATGSIHVIGRPHLEALRDGAVLANAGHFDVEIDLGALREASVGREVVRPLVDEFDLGGRRVLLIAGGRVVNLAAADGHPADVMDLLFAGQAIAAAWLAEHGSQLERGVHGAPREIDVDLARLALAAMDVRLDDLSDEQRRYLTAWAPGSPGPAAAETPSG